MMSWDYRQPVVIHFGNGRIAEIGKEIDTIHGSNGLIVTMPALDEAGIIDRIVTAGNGRIRHVFTDVSPNPDVTECEKCITVIKENACDFIIAVGGGSVLDCAKAAAVMSTLDRPVTDYLKDMSLLPNKKIPLIAVPTTAGTGSEITCVSVLTDHAAGIKKPLSCDAFYPSLAIIDPELTYSVPQHVTACTGMDVLCHAIEAYWSKYHQPICDALAVHAARLVFENLRTACSEPDNVAAREKMAEASVIAGLAFTVPKTTSAHACSYPLTNLLHIAHGEACALTIEHFLRINAAHDEGGRLQFLAGSLGFADAYALADGIARLKKDIGVMSDLRSFHLTPEQTEALIQGSKHPNLLNNPVEITEDMLRRLYLTLTEG